VDGQASHAFHCITQQRRNELARVNCPRLFDAGAPVFGLVGRNVASLFDICSLGKKTKKTKEKKKKQGKKGKEKEKGKKEKVKQKQKKKVRKR
jgi:hypothetical protein